MNEKRFNVDISTVRLLIATQFPEWEMLPINPVAPSGWDNYTFRLGETMLIRMPSAAAYELQVEKEQKWLPKLAPLLPLPIPFPLAMGQPAYGYPLKWSIYKRLDGDAAELGNISDFCDIAQSLAQFLCSFHQISTQDGPVAGLHSFYRGGSLKNYDIETRQAINVLKNKIDARSATEIWKEALSTQWDKTAVWVHGDISQNNLLIKNGKLAAVIDFGQLAVGDPSCDLAIAWTLFDARSRDVFRNILQLDKGTWARARGWALWKALIAAAGFTESNSAESYQCWMIIDKIIDDTRD